MATAVMGAGSALKAVGAIRQGNADASIADYNAQIASQNAAAVLSQGAEQERVSRVQAGKQIGGMVAAYGASGVTADGSASDVIRNSAASAELNALTLRNNADIKATALRNEASLDYYRSSNDKVAGYMNAASALLQGGSSMVMMGKGGGGGDDSSAAADLSAEEDGDY